MKSHSPEHQATAPVITATAQSLPDQADALARARAFAEPLLASETLDTGENALVHADAVAAILKSIGGSQAMQAASYLVYACDHLNKPYEVIAKAFGENFAELALETTKLVRVQRMARLAQLSASRAATPIPMAQTASAQTESVRKMLLAFSRDLRVVMLRLASRLLLIPVLAGIAYEFIRYTASHLDNRLVRALIQPGLWLQGLTTREPDDSMLACAIAALVPVLAADGIQVEMPARTAPAAMPAPLAA
mgnify:CR=1 FL=1